MNEWAYRIFYFFSLLPIFRMTCDEGFGAIRKDKTLLRFSLLSLNVGKHILHFCTFQWFWGTPPQGVNRENFRIFRIISLLKVQKPLDQQSFDQKVADHKLIVVNNPPNREAIKEALFYKSGQLTDTKNRTFNKYLAYLAIVAFLIPIFVPYLTNLKKINQYDNLFQWLVYIIVFYLAINFYNLLVFFLEYIKVKSYKRYSYGDVRDSPDPSIELIQMVYYEKYLSDFESIGEVTVIKNIEKYIKGIVLMSIFLFIVHNASVQFKPDPKLELKQTGSSAVYSLDLSKPQNQLYDGQDVLLDRLSKDLREGEIKEVILIRPGDGNEENFKRILYLIQSLNVHNIEVTTGIDYATQIGNRLIILLKRR